MLSTWPAVSQQQEAEEKLCKIKALKHSEDLTKKLLSLTEKHYGTKFAPPEKQRIMDRNWITMEWQLKRHYAFFD